jgi:iron complex outermembrane receptor protein
MGFDRRTSRTRFGRRGDLGVALLAATALISPAAAWAQTGSAAAGAAAAPQAAAAAVGEVIVTARKSRERLEDVPIAIAALNGAELNHNGHLRIEDLNALTPSTNIVITNGHQTSVSIRGLGNNPGNDGLEGSAGVFLDGVYLGRPGMAATDLIDISQIEVLRGPQGTLFGKNTTAGAVNITTQAPSFTFGGAAQATYGNYNYQQYQGSVTGPLAGDVLAGRLTAYSTTRSGDVYDVTTGQNVGTLDRTGARGQLLYKPTDDFSLRLIGEYEREQQSTGAVLLFNSPGATPAALQKSLTAVGASIVFDPKGATTAAGQALQTGTRQGAASAEANWTKNGFTLTSLTAWRRWDYASYSDTDGTAADVITAGYNIHDTQWSQELRLKFPSIGPVDAVTGLYYFQQDLYSDQITAYGPDAAAWLSGVPNSLLPIYAKLSPALAGLVAYNSSRWDVISTPRTRSYAAFGQAVWHVDPKWNVTAGLRVTSETKDETVSRANPTSLTTGAPVTALASQTVAPFSVGISNTAPSWLISTDYHLRPTVMLYGSVSRGEKAGGVNTTVPGAGQTPNSLKVQPETATDVEIGIKGDLFGRKLSFNLDAFHTDVSDYQATFIQTVNGSTVQLLTNVGKVRTQGFEAEGTLRPVAGLTITANGSFNDAIYASYPDGPCAAELTGRTVCNLTGRPVAGAPRWVGNIDMEYEHPVTNALSAYGAVEYSYRSQYYGYLDDSAYSSTGDYGLLNLRAGVRAGHWDLSVWGKNVGDTRYVANYLSYGSLIPGVYVPFFGDFRTFGVTLRAAF